MIELIWISVLLLIAMGLGAAVLKKNLIKIVMGISVLGSGVNLFLVSLGYRTGSIAPIFTDSQKLVMALPTPQALTLTSIVISLAVTALMLSFAMMLYSHNKTLNTKTRRLKE